MGTPTMNRRGVMVLKSERIGLGPNGRATKLPPGEYPFTIMDGDDDIATLGDPEQPEVLIARLPLSFADTVRDQP